MISNADYGCISVECLYLFEYSKHATRERERGAEECNGCIQNFDNKCQQSGLNRANINHLKKYITVCKFSGNLFVK